MSGILLSLSVIASQFIGEAIQALKSGVSRTIESLSLLRERWHAKRDGEGLE